MIVVDGIGCSYVHSKGWEIDRPSGLDNYLFLHIETPADVLVDDKIIYYTEPCFIMFKKGQKQYFRNHEKMTYIDSWVHFRSDEGMGEGEDEVEALLKELDVQYGKPVIIYNTIELSDLWHLVDAEFHQAGNHKKELLDMKMRSLIYKFVDIMHAESGTSNKYNRYRKAFGELRNSIFSGNNAAMITDVEELARSQNMSLSYFEHVYKALFQVPVTKDIIKSRIGYAKYLLRSTNNSIMNIANYCGYENIEHFNRQFKATVGYTPTQFRSGEFI